MAKRCKLDKTQVCLDFVSAIKSINKKQKPNPAKNKKDISLEIGFSVVSINQWIKEAPEVVTMIFHFLKDNNLKFEDLVKEVNAEVNKSTS